MIIDNNKQMEKLEREYEIAKFLLVCEYNEALISLSRRLSGEKHSSKGYTMSEPK